MLKLNNMNNTSKIIVLGANGMVGRAFVRRLKEGLTKAVKWYKLHKNEIK